MLLVEYHVMFEDIGYKTSTKPVYYIFLCSLFQTYDVYLFENQMAALSFKTNFVYPVQYLKHLRKKSYLVKTCYHYSTNLQ